MCYYRHYIFLGCGHSTTSSKPVSTCTTTSTLTKSEIKAPAPAPASRPDSGVFFADSAPHSVTDADEECAPGPSTPAPPQPNADTPNLPQSRVDQEPPDKQAKEEGGRRRCRERHYHPRQTFKLERLCLHCTVSRQKLLAVADTGSGVKFEDWRWRVKYLFSAPEEARYAQWGAVGEVMGSWVKDWRTRGDELMKVWREGVLEEGARDGGASRVRILGAGAGSERRGSALGGVGARRGMGSS